MSDLCGRSECVGAAQQRNYRHAKLTPPSVADVDHPTIRCFDFLHPSQQSSDLSSNLPTDAVGSGVGHSSKWLLRGSKEASPTLTGDPARIASSTYLTRLRKIVRNGSQTICDRTDPLRNTFLKIASTLAGYRYALASTG